MRHFGTLLAAVVIAPLAWLLLAFGQGRSLETFAGQGTNPLDSGDFLQPLLFLSAAGILLGLIATLRFSPLGAFITGIVYAGSYALLLAAPEKALNALPTNVSIAGYHADATTPLRTGTAALVGATMLLAVVSIGRWRRWPKDDSSFWDRRYDDDRTTTAIRRDPWGEPDTVPEREPVNLMRWTSSLRR